MSIICLSRSGKDEIGESSRKYIFTGGAMVKNPPARAGDAGDVGLIPGKIPWSRKWEPTPVFLPEKEPGGLQYVGLQRIGQD